MIYKWWVSHIFFSLLESLLVSHTHIYIYLYLANTFIYRCLSNCWENLDKKKTRLSCKSIFLTGLDDLLDFQLMRSWKKGSSRVFFFDCYIAWAQICSSLCKREIKVILGETSICLVFAIGRVNLPYSDCYLKFAKVPHSLSVGLLWKLVMFTLW